MKTRLLIAIVGACLVGCMPQDPVRIIITPTAQNSATPSAEMTTEATVESVAFALATVTLEPIVITNTQEPTRTPITGDGTFMGSILRPDYTITPPATNAPTLIPTLDPSQPLPSATPITVSSPSLDPIEMGMQIYYNMGPEDFRNVLYLAQQAKVGWAKFQLNWSFLQPNSSGEMSDAFRLFVIQVQSAKNMGFRTLLSVAKAPQWARNTDKSEDGPPDNPQELVNFLQQLLTEIKVENVDAIEIWNEPNLIREWHGVYPLSGAGYMQFFAPVFSGLQAIAPRIHIITAGLAPTGTTANTVNDRDYLQQMFDAGLAQYTNVSVGVHPYGWGNPPDAVCCNAVDGQGWDDQPQFFFIQTLDDYRNILNANNYAPVQLWVTEFGWATWAGFPTEAPEVWMTYNTPEEQAEYGLRAFQIGQERADIGPMFLWNFNFANETLIQERNEVAGYSILAPNLSGEGDPLLVRPLYTALRDRP
jgi:polysaccharide biosynthesis protein PslG